MLIRMKTIYSTKPPPWRNDRDKIYATKSGILALIFLAT
jgi:hypothetical protein